MGYREREEEIGRERKKERERKRERERESEMSARFPESPAKVKLVYVLSVNGVM